MPDDAVRAVAELAASQHRAFTRSQAAALHFDHRRIATAKRHGWLDEPVPGVLVLRGSAASWHQRLMVAVLAGGGAAVASHRSAARLHQLDGFADDGMAVVEASVDRHHRLQLDVDLVAHHVTPLGEIDVTAVDGIPCTSLARTLADLGSVVGDRRRVQRALTDARRRHVGLAHLRQTAERLHRPGQAGTGTLLRLLDAIPTEGRVPDSWFEELLARCLADSTLDIVLQCPIVDRTGRVVARADIGIPAARLGLEAHSRRFHWGPIAGRLDEERDLAAAACGWELLYLGWHATKRPADVLRLVKDVVAARRCELTRLTPAV